MPVTQPAGPDVLDARVLGVMAALGAGSLLLAWALGVFRRRSIVGPVRWRAGESPAVLLLPMMVGIGAWLFVSMTYGMLRGRTAPAPSDAATTAPASAPSETFSSGELVILTTLAAVALFVATTQAHRRLRPGGLTALGFALPRIQAGFLLGLLGMLVIAVPMMWVGFLTPILWDALELKTPTVHEMLKILSDSPSPLLRVVIVLSAAVVAPLAEELMFRGHLQTLLAMTIERRRGKGTTEVRGPIVEVAFGTDPTSHSPPSLPEPPSLSPMPPPAWVRWAAVVLTSLAFAGVHPWWMFPPIFVLSVCLGYVYERTGNLWVPIIIHALFNGTQTALFLAGAAGN
ncbi:MAG: lysostaphin resistance A-like protein [Tepidisphaeraceae bacterium]